MSFAQENGSGIFATIISQHKIHAQRSCGLPPSGEPAFNPVKKKPENQSQVNGWQGKRIKINFDLGEVARW